MQTGQPGDPHPEDPDDQPLRRPDTRREEYELGTDGPRILLVGIDGSDSSMRAAAYAGGMARRQNSRIVAVYVRPLMPRWPTTAGSVAAIEVSSGEIAEELIAEVRAGARRLGFHNWEFRIERGEPFAVLCRLADDLHADGVFVGASMQAQHRFAGSLALKLVRTGRWPVTVVP